MQLIRYDAACRALAECKAIDEVKDWRDKAQALQAYAKQAKNKQLEVDAAEIRIRAERRLGQMLQETAETGERQTRGGDRKAAESKSIAPTLIDIGISKDLSARAQAIASVPEQQFEQILSEAREEQAAVTGRMMEKLARESTRSSREAELSGKAVALPADKYSLIYADPPWRYEHVKTESRAIENQYPTMSLEDICALPVAEMAHDDCVLFLWATSPKLAEAMRVIESWGFTYRTCAVWDKEVIGMGYYFRQQHELLLIATRGEPGAPAVEARESSVHRERRGQHSAKPGYYGALIERMYPNAKKIELFCRAPRDGWNVWGYEAA